VRRALVLCSVLVLGACGGGSSHASATTHALAKLKVVVSAQSRHPVIGHTWSYEVKVTANGKPVACTIHVQVFFNGFSVGEVGTHAVKTGIWKETIPAKGKNAFPPASIGQHIVWHAIATAKGYAKGAGGLPISVVRK
jgi:hypothetical protein